MVHHTNHPTIQNAEEIVRGIHVMCMLRSVRSFLAVAEMGLCLSGHLAFIMHQLILVTSVTLPVSRD
ncbi:hypothetical protein NQ117_18745 [Paenibacillus sp. SC116]|nr:hypothetical protein [Paenibacillus sp. SC116]